MNGDNQSVTGARKFFGWVLLIWAWVWLVMGVLTILTTATDADDVLMRMIGYTPFTFLWFVLAKLTLGGAKRSSWWKVWKDTTGAAKAETQEH